MNRPVVLLVDLHGTLIPTAKFISKAFAQTIHAQCPSVSPQEMINYYLDFQGTPLEEKVAHGLNRGGKTLSPKAFDRFMVQLWKRIAAMPLKPYSETVADLTELKKEGVKLFVSTDNPAWVARAFLKKTGLEKLFSGVLGKPMSGDHKVVEHVQVLAKRLHIPSAEISKHFIFYGDSLGEMNAARKIGIPAIGRVTSYSFSKMKKAGARHIVLGRGAVAKGRLKKHVFDLKSGRRRK